jgi:hypothetical protein
MARDEKGGPAIRPWSEVAYFVFEPLADCEIKRRKRPMMKTVPVGRRDIRRIRATGTIGGSARHRRQLFIQGV